MITLYSNHHSINLTLPKESVWIDEFDWTAAKSRSFYSINGDLIIEPSFTAKGRPITLSGSNAVFKRNDLETLYSWVNVPNHSLVLTLHDGRNFDTMFRLWDSPVIEAKTPFGGYAKPEDNHYYELTIKLVTV